MTCRKSDLPKSCHASDVRCLKRGVLKNVAYLKNVLYLNVVCIQREVSQSSSIGRRTCIKQNVLHLNRDAPNVARMKRDVPNT